MSDAQQWMQNFLQRNQAAVPANKKPLLENFLQNEKNRVVIDSIIQNEHALMARWKQQNRIAEILQQPVRVLNATVGKPYETVLHFEKLKWTDITEAEFIGLEELGLTFDKQAHQITGVPTQSGDKKILFRFRIEGQPTDEPPAEKEMTLIINPDPKSLWKNIESNRDDPYWKEDNVTRFEPLGDRHILVSSKRGRSHANNGSFREDDYAFSKLENGWWIVVVADGAGSAKVSRKGSVLACKGIVDYFHEPSTVENMMQFDNLLHQYKNNQEEESQKNMNRFVYNTLGKGAFQVHKILHQFAQDQALTLKDLSTTLVFTLFKKYDVGYAFLSFGVGDCPAAVINREFTEVTLLNVMDVGEFSGGTRFITMPEIFQNEKFAGRFKFKLLDDFSYLVLMSDGIFDPKFSVEANLADLKKWQAFFADLNGQNEDKAKVELRKDNPQIEQQFSDWMDFWSPGNHDDRTLAIVF